LGAAAGRLFVQEGARVAIADLPSQEKKGQEVVAELNKIRAGSAIWVPLDVTKDAQWASAVAEVEKKFGPLDVLYNKLVSNLTRISLQ
jgi:3alpha(or 20beta)-hydroxysteroid dehydrogenase